MNPKALCLTTAGLFFLCATAVAAETLIPTAIGTTWTYEVKDEPSVSPGGGDGWEQIVRIAGLQEFEGKTLLKFETVDADKQVAKTELTSVNDRGVVCVARSKRDGALEKLEPAETLVPAALKVGGAFDVDGDLAGVRLHQHYIVAADETVHVPAGAFRAFRLHCDAKSLMSTEADRWFAPGVGFVKNVTTIRGPSGGLLQRTTTELKKRPEVIVLPSPTPKPTATPTATPSETAQTEVTASPIDPTSPAPVGKRLVVEVSGNPDAGMTTDFKSDVERIYVRWRGHDLPEGAKVRVAWVAEDVGGLVDPNFIVDQTETAVPSPNASARFTLGRPEDGWAEGKYRVEFYINDQLEEKIDVTIR